MPQSTPPEASAAQPPLAQPDGPLLPGPMGDRLTVTLHYLAELVDHFADGLLQQRFGLSYNQFVFIAVLSNLEPPPDITTLAECLGVSKAAVSKRVPAFVEAGWVATRTDPLNARRVRLTLTPKATALLAEAGPIVDAAFTELFADLPGVDLPALHRDLKSIARRLEARVA
ncbi:MarR family winged helix-turn-helix transcriptional regulator [Agromyces soli]